MRSAALEDEALLRAQAVAVALLTLQSVSARAACSREGSPCTRCSTSPPLPTRTRSSARTDRFVKEPQKERGAVAQGGACTWGCGDRVPLPVLRV